MDQNYYVLGKHTKRKGEGTKETFVLQIYSAVALQLPSSISPQ